MFLLPTNSAILERIAKVATSSGATMEDVAEAALVKGLVILEATPVMKADVDKQLVPPGTELTSEESFIMENWRQMSDEQMAESLNRPVNMIGIKRRVLGLLRPRGPKNPGAGRMITERQPGNLDEKEILIVKERMAKESDSQIALSLNRTVSAVKAAKRTIARELIKQHWQKMSDADLASRLDINPSAVVLIRNEFGFRRRSKTSMVAQLDMVALRQALLEEGETLRSFHKKKKLRMSYQRLQQICQENGIDFTKRTPGWHTKNLARKTKCPTLADKQKLEAILAKYKGFGSAAGHLGVSFELLKKALKLHGVDPKLFMKKTLPNPIIELVCSNPLCPLPDRKFSRELRFERMALRKNPLHVPYCGKTCFGQHMGKTTGFHTGHRKEEKTT